MLMPKQYQWLNNIKEPPRILTEAMRAMGVHEKLGRGSNPTIMQWAKRTGMGNVYTDDSIPWCGLFMAYAVMQAGFDAPVNPLWARNWLTFGRDASGDASLGDVLVFTRGKSGHVGIYVGEDRDCYHVLGGNQSDSVMIKRIAKARCIGHRRCKWRINQPAGVKPIHLPPSGKISTNEA